MPPTLSGQSKPALAALILGGMVIGASPVFVRLSEVGAVPTAFWRLALALVPLFFLARRPGAGGEAKPRGLRQIWLVSLPGLILGTELMAWHISLHMTSVANSTLLVNMAPVFVALYSWLILRRPPGRLFLFALVLTLLGVVVLKGGPAALGDGHLAGDAVAIFAAALYAAYLVILTRVRETFAASVIMLWSTAAAALAVLPFALADGGALLPWTLAGWLVLFGLSWLSQAGGQSLIAWALAWLPATFSSLTLLLQPVVAALLAWAVLGEALTPWQAVGGVIVLAGIWTARLAQKRG
ncbi:DMT family transporter [Pseudogemmobacter humi]|uniref:EamA-like transporter family protein n=1 Tax=Pseudogemmobacter humi TaxID=2483812 RepID=A0A3P5WGE0_9RHOB|nr:DMT family transporter [Pseudogemmobacter humi]VDC20415.1 EamA-like transporter family protein [Pseudogemmobacter humi]